MNRKRTAGVTASILIALSRSLPVFSQSQQVGYYPANELRGVPGLIYDPPPEAYGPTLNSIPGATAPGNIISPNPGESRAWKTGAPLTDVVKFRDLQVNPQFAGFTKFSLRSFNQNIGADIGGVPLKEIELVNGLNLQQLKTVYNNGNIKIKDSLPIVQSLIGVVFDPRGAQRQLRQNALSTGKKVLINRLSKEKSLKDVPFQALLNGDWRGTITHGEQLLLKEIANDIPDHLHRLPIGSLTISVIEGDFSKAQQQAKDYAINEIYDMTLNEALQRFPELQTIPVGSIASIANQPLDQSLPQIADLAIENIPGVEDKLLSSVPGLGDSPAGAVLGDVIAAFIAGDVFAKFDIAHSGQDGPEEFFGRPLSGGTPDNKFKVIPGIKSTDSKTKTPKKGFPRWEMKPAEPGGVLNGEPLLGKEWMSRDQRVPGCKGILCIFGKWEPAGIKPVQSSPVKFSLGNITENPNGPSTARIWVDFQKCIVILFTKHCTAHIISFKTPWKIQNESLFPVLARRRVQDYFPGVDTSRRTVDFCQPPTFLASANPQASVGSSPPDDSKYGHLAYTETTDQLFNVTAVDGVTVGLQKDAAQAFEQMRRDAAAQGLDIKGVSGFRSVALQQSIWDSKVASQSPEVVAQTSAPPGYSEHHTGYAIDVGNNANPNLTQDWANTPEYAWMQQNAASYGFELSFPQGNSQGVSFEPWHWRYVGSDTAKATFNAQTKQVQTIGQSAWGSETDIHNLILTSALESTGTQNQVDVAVAIMNRVVSPKHPNTITEVVFQPRQYQPNFGQAPVTSKEEAIARIAKKTGSIQSAIVEYETIEAALNDPNQIAASQAFLKGATDFRGQSLLYNLRPGDPYRGNAGANYYFQESQDPAVAAATLGVLGVESTAVDPSSIQSYGNSVGCNPNTLLSSNNPGPFVQGSGVSTGNFQDPLGNRQYKVTSNFGWRNHPVYGGTSFHAGIDLAWDAGTPITAADGGVVVKSFWNGGYGNYILIDHGNGLATWYAHNRANYVKVGDKVDPGQVIGEVGSTGTSTGAHLDFGVKERFVTGSPDSGQIVDPRKYFNFPALGGYNQPF